MVLRLGRGVNVLRIGNSIGGTLFKNKQFYEFRPFSSEVQNDKKSTSFVPFMDMLKLRKEQAARSILVQVQSPQSYKQLYTYCETIGKVENMFHYSVEPDPLHFIIVEFANEEDIKSVLASSTHIQDHHTIPVTSQFLWFRAATKKLGKVKQSKLAKLQIENATNIISESDLCSKLNQCASISEQMNELYNSTRLNDAGQLLRFLTARQIETTLSGMFPRICAYPFGSSVNGFGKMGCDLDIVLRLTAGTENEASRLIYHCKAGSGTERTINQRNMEVLGDLIHLFLPGCAQVRRILQARVPIIKYHQQFTNVECDLSMSNMSGVYMSDFLYLMGELDPRVRPLIFTIRKWAKETFLTNSSPGKWITNFSLTLLALAFLQKPLNSPPVLPTLNQLIKAAGQSDTYSTEDGVDGTFLRDIKKLNFQTDNKESLHSLLREFFEYYSQFDFGNKAVCLNEAVSLTKPEYSPLYIVNPLERGLNVSKNVSIEELERLKTELRNAAWLLDTNEEHPDKKGILTLFSSKINEDFKSQFSFSSKHNRLMEVSTLFDEESEARQEEIYKSKSVEKQVENIKKETRDKIKLMSNQPRIKTGR